MSVLAVFLAGCAGQITNSWGIPAAIDPGHASLQHGAELNLRAYGIEGARISDVQWSVREAGGGAVVRDPLDHSRAKYTAPQTAGTYHVDASVHFDPTGSYHTVTTIRVDQTAN